MQRLKELEALEPELKEKVKKIMMIIPNIIDPSVPIGKDDSENVEVQKYGEPVVPDFEIPYHADIMEALEELTSIQQERLQETASTISWAT